MNPALPSPASRNTLGLSVLLAWGIGVGLIYNFGNAPSLLSFAQAAAAMGLPTAAAALNSTVAIVIASWLWLLFTLTGRIVWRRLAPPRSDRWDTAIFSAGLGAGCWMLGLLLLGMTGFWQRHVLIGIGLTASLLAICFNRDLYGAFFPAHPGGVFAWRHARTWATCHPSLSDKTLAGALILTLLVCLVGALTPEIFYDSLVYHLNIPRLWLLEGRIVPTPTYCFSGIPFNMEMLYGLAMAAGSDTTAKLIHFGAGVAALAVLYRMTSRYSSHRAGLLGGLIFSTSPMMMLEFGKTAVELGSTFFTLLAVYALLRSEEISRAPSAGKWLVISGVSCGLAMGTKYTTWLLLPALVMTHAVLAFSLEPPRHTAVWIRRTRKISLEVCLIMLPALVVVSPWILKNVIFYGNPLYPFLDGFFPNPITALANFPALQAEAGRNLTEFGSVDGIVRLVLEPWFITMKGKTGADFVGPVYLALLPWLLIAPNRRVMKALVLIFLFQGGASFLISNVPRLWAPSLACLAGLLAVSFTETSMPVWSRRGFSVLMCLLLATNVFDGSLHLYRQEGWKVVLGQVSKSSYLSTPHPTYPNPYFRAADFINRQTPQDARVLLVGEARGFYLERSFLGASVYDTHRIFTWSNSSQDGESLYALLREQGFTHILLNVSEGARTRNYILETFSRRGAAVFDQFWRRHVRELFRDGDDEFPSSLVYEITDDNRSAASDGTWTPNLFLDLHHPETR